jgi:hypothetical protein
MAKAYLQFGGAALGKPGGPFETIETEARFQPAPRKGQTVTGYGSAMPLPYMVKLHDKWRRVYCANYGNAGTAYIGKPGAWEAIVSTIED